MRHLLLLPLFLLFTNSKACVCLPVNFADKYAHSDFVARATIVKNYKNKGAESFYKSDIAISEVYKGEKTTSIFIEGSSDGIKRTSCDLFFPEKTELIIYANKRSPGVYIFNSCSGYLILKGKYASEKRELDMLGVLKNQGISFTTKIWFSERFDFEEELRRTNHFRGIHLDKEYALYEITFSSDVKIKSIVIISGFGKEMDERLVAILKKSEWNSMIPSSDSPLDTRSKVPDNSKYLVGFYFYPSEQGHPSFVSEYDL